nr:MAG TPA: hypothetical protein [Caudoviricetes sp.]
MDVKVLSFNLNVSDECVEQELASYLRLGYKIKGQSHSDKYLIYTLVEDSPTLEDKERKQRIGGF